MALEAQLDPLVGTVLEGRFQVERLLGEGGMGRVYVADELRLRRRCALKVLLPELTQDKDCVERFLREAQAIAQIHHEHVVDIYHLGEDVNSGVVFFAMELLVGKDLETRLLERAKKPITWQQVAVWMEQVASAMAAVHAAGMIHRDLKPSNIFLTTRRDGRDQVKLLDFGIAKVANHAALTSTGAALGTPFYMSPEQILAQALDTRTDIYSLGVVFFEALAGRMPFVGEPIQVAMQHCNVAPPRIADVAPGAGIPVELDDLIQRMLAKDREARTQTMEEVETFLHDFLPSYTSSSTARPITGPVASASNLHDSSALAAAAYSQQKTVLAPSTPPGGLPRVAASGARTSLDTRPPATTVEIHLDPEAAARAPRPAARLLVPLLGGVALLGVVLLLALGGGEDPPPAPPADTVVVAGPPVEPPVTPPAGTDPGGTTPTVAPEPVPSDTAAAPPDPVPSDTPPDTKGDEPKVRKPPAPKAGEKTADKPGDPLKQIRRAAEACRKKHKAVKGAKITVDYVIGSDGAVTRAVPATQDALGKCLADAVKAAKFPPQLKLGLKIDL